MMDIMFAGACVRRIAVMVLCALFVMAPQAMAGTESYSYDVLGRVTAVTYGDASHENFTYDAAGNRTQLTRSGGAEISATSVAITAGNSTTLNWTISNGVTATLNGTSITATNGSMSVTPDATTIYTLAVTYADGNTTSSSVTVTVVPQPTGTLSASAVTVTSGNAVTLTWAASNAVSETLAGSSFNTTGGTMTVYPTSPSTTYTLVVTNSLGATNSYSVTVNVVAAPTGTIATSAALTQYGGTATLTWSASDATSATVNGASVSTSGGTMDVSPANTTVYTLAVTNAAGTTNSYSVTVKVNHAPVAVNDTATASCGTIAYTTTYLCTAGSTLTANDTDADGDSLTVTAFSGGSI
ncbi:MAG: Ig-like domain-containing protein, partial [Rhizomicrobium sp.]